MPVGSRPYVLLSAAMSLDGCLDDAGPRRLLLSTEADLDRVDEVRAGVDAILVGAGTVRADDPRLIVRSLARVERRVGRGLPAQPAAVVLTGGGPLDPTARVFTGEERRRLVYVPDPAAPACRAALGDRAAVVGAGDPFDVHRLLADLAGRGVERLMVEGGGTVHTLFLTADVVDELHLVIAPFFVGDAGAPRFVRPGVFPRGPGRPVRLTETRRLDDVVLLRYLFA